MRTLICMLFVLCSVVTCQPVEARLSLQSQLNECKGFEKLEVFLPAGNFPRLNPLTSEIVDLLEFTFKTDCFYVLETNQRLNEVKTLFCVAVVPEIIDNINIETDIEGKLWVYGCLYMSIDENYFDYDFSSSFADFGLETIPKLETLRAIFYNTPLTLPYNLEITDTMATDENYATITTELMNVTAKFLKSDEKFLSYALRWYRDNNYISVVYFFGLTSQNRIIGTVQSFVYDFSECVYIFDSSDSILSLSWEFTTMSKIIDRNIFLDWDNDNFDGVKPLLGIY